MDKYGVMSKPTNIRDTRILVKIENILKEYDEIIQLLDIDKDQSVNDMGIDLRDSLQNLRRIYNLINSAFVANVLDGTEKGEKFIKIMYINPIEIIFNKYGIKSYRGVE